MNEKFSRRRLPHWDKPDAAFFITTCLAGSIPAQGLIAVERLRVRLNREPRPATVTAADWRTDRWKRTFACRETWLDTKSAVRHLERPDLAAAVVAALQFFHNTRYALIAWVVMPSHYHWVFQPLTRWVDSLGTDAGSPRQRIQHSVNRHSAARCNQLLHRQGAFWQHESYDHWVRDEDELERIVDYIHANPVVAGLVERPDEYPFSSAYRGPAV